MMKNRYEAEDLLQNSFIDVFTKLDSYNYSSTPGAWIKRICINNCINELKRRKIQFDQMNENMDGGQEIELTKKKVNVAIIKNAIDKLPDGYRVIFNLYAVEGYDHQEISEILDINISSSSDEIMIGVGGFICLCLAIYFWILTFRSEEIVMTEHSVLDL